MSLNTLLNSYGGLPGQFWSIILGAVIGAFVSGVIALIIQVYGVRAARVERLAIKRQKEIATAFSTLTRIIKIRSSLHNIVKSVAESVKRLELPQHKGMQPWQVIRPFATLPTEVQLTAPEAAFLLSTKDPKLMLNALELVDVYNDFIQMLAAYAAKRDALKPLLPAVAVAGNMARSELSPEDMQTFLPQMIDVSVLADGIIARSEQDLGQAVEVFEALKSHCEIQFGSDFPKFGRPADSKG